MKSNRSNAARFLTTIPVAAIAVSWSAIFIRFADAPSLIIAFYRMVTATLILTIWALGPGRRSFAGVNLKLVGQTILSGFFLALHFAFWISSLSYTPVANSVMLVSSTPIFAAIFGHFVLKERPHPIAYPAMLLAIGGGAIIMGGDFHWAPQQAVGDLLAIAGAIMAAAYFIMGRLIQRSLPVFPYIFLTYASSAVFLGVFALAAGKDFTGYSQMTWLWFILLGLVCTVIGHSLYNRALRFFKTHVVSVAVLAEPVGATVLAYFFLAELPPWYALLGAVPIFIGVAWVFWLERGKQNHGQPPGYGEHAHGSHGPKPESR